METGRVSRLLEGHDSASTCAAISPDGKVLATGTYAGRIIFWDVATGDRIGELATGLEYSVDIDFSPDGSLLATATLDGIVRLWPTVVPASPDAQTSADIVLGWSNDARYPNEEQ
jgi:WD40 repeat protein